LPKANFESVFGGIRVQAKKQTWGTVPGFLFESMDIIREFYRKVTGPSGIEIIERLDKKCICKPFVEDDLISGQSIRAVANKYGVPSNFVRSVGIKMGIYSPKK